MPRLALLVAAIAVFLTGAACTSSSAAEPIDATACPAGTQRVIEYRLFMGRNSGGEEVVDDQTWDVFVRDIVTPKFPAGLTVLDGHGQWQDASGVVDRERSKVLVILAQDDDEAPQRIAEVARAYKGLFNQFAVLVTSEWTCASFW